MNLWFYLLSGTLCPCWCLLMLVNDIQVVDPERAVRPTCTGI